MVYIRINNEISAANEQGSGVELEK